MKEKIRAFIESLGVDDVGITSVTRYNSPKSPPVENFFPGARSIIVLAYRELASCESPNMQLAMSGRYGVDEVMHHDSYKICHFLETNFHAKTLFIPKTFTMDLRGGAPKGISDFSLRHAAVAAGLGSFGRHNLVIHPRLGTRVNFAAILTDLEIEPDERAAEDLCSNCNLCVENCPARALDEEGKTDVLKCMKVSKPFGPNPLLMYLSQFMASSREERMEMMKTMSFMPFYQAAAGERDYNCFNCLKSCPIGRD